MEQELWEHGEALSALNDQIQELNASLTYGNLGADEMQRLSELHAEEQGTEEELAARTREMEELIGQKKLLMNAAVSGGTQRAFLCQPVHAPGEDLPL